jgi:Uncharacterized proteins, LmbE homologs
MISLDHLDGEQPLSILCLGAHSDDIEIGAGGTLLTLIGQNRCQSVHWCVVSACGKREDEAHNSALTCLAPVRDREISLGQFKDSDFPSQREAIKEWLLEIRERFRPDIVFTHARLDAHQDHREINQLTWNLFRDSLILEYEIPKWDGDLGQPNAYVALTAETLERKIEILQTCFGSQRSKDWFDAETFRGLARVRGMECRAPERFAEAFYARKLRLF